jgi:hypothetical protein
MCTYFSYTFFQSYISSIYKLNIGLWLLTCNYSDVDVTDKNKKGSYRPVFLSENAITLSDKVQLVVRFYGEPSQLHENYDYAHAMCYYKYATDELSCPQEALECMLSKTLIYKGSLYPLASIFRLRKFIARGWRISAGQMLKIMFQISKLDFSDSKVLYEQLIGVDQAYMHQLIRALENREPGTRIGQLRQDQVELDQLDLLDQQQLQVQWQVHALILRYHRYLKI